MIEDGVRFCRGLGVRLLPHEKPPFNFYLVQSKSVKNRDTKFTKPSSSPTLTEEGKEQDCKLISVSLRAF